MRSVSEERDISQSSGFWDKIKIASGAVAAILVLVAIARHGSRSANAVKSVSEEDDVIQPKDRWDKTKVVSGVIAAIFVPAAIAIVGNAITVSLKDRDVRLKTVELAINVLRDDPKDNPETKALRKWATDVIDAYSGIPLSQEAKDELQRFPILRGQTTLSCTVVPAELQLPSYRSASVMEDQQNQSCVFAVDGGGATRASCQRFDAHVSAPSTLTIAVSETSSKCVFSIH